MTNDEFMEVVTEEELAERVAQLGSEISADYAGAEPVLLSVLKGSVPFAADLIRHLPNETVVDFLSITRFGTEGRVNIALDASITLHGRDVILVEDIVDTGLTLTALLRMLEQRNPASIRTVTLLDKVPRRIVEVDLAYRGFEVGDEFLLGYGLDWEGRYRNLRSLWAILDIAGFQADTGPFDLRVFGADGDRLAV